MSWLDDNEPRFYVSTVSGFQIDPATNAVTWGVPKMLPISAAVLDRAYAHKIVREWVPALGGSHRGVWCLQQAELYCAELNAQEDAGLLTEDAA